MPGNKPPLNYTTMVPESHSAGECVQLLADAGASAVTVTYEQGKPAGLGFRLEFGGIERDYVMPVDIDGVLACLERANYSASIAASVRARYKTRDHARRVAWRITKEWLQVELAIIDAGMTTLSKTMLAYLQVETGGFYEAVEQRASLAAIDA